MMKLDPTQRRQLRIAMLQALPTRNEWQRIVRDGLDRNLDTITSGGNLQDVLDEVISWAERHDKLIDLITAAQEENSDNVALHSIAEKILPKLKAPIRKPADHAPFPPRSHPRAP